MAVLHDEEFGDITIRRSARASQVKLRVAPNGSLRASMPLYAPLFLLKRLVKASRPQLRRMLAEAQPVAAYYNGQQVGKSHVILVTASARSFSVKRDKQHIFVTLPPTRQLEDADVTQEIRKNVIEALRAEAKSYLPRRLEYLAKQHGFTYTNVRFSHASSRWGSCSSNGTISLNIALMKLPFELIDYVLIHELSHTRHMNHSQAFWGLVAQGDTNYKEHRRALRDETPAI